MSAYNLSEGLHEEILRRTALDRQLYAAANARLDGALATIPPAELAAELRAWRVLQATLAAGCDDARQSAALPATPASRPCWRT